MEAGGFGPNMIAGEGLPTTQTPQPSEFFPPMTSARHPNDGFSPMNPPVPLSSSHGFPPRNPAPSFPNYGFPPMNPPVPLPRTHSFPHRRPVFPNDGFPPMNPPQPLSSTGGFPHMNPPVPLPSTDGFPPRNPAPAFPNDGFPLMDQPQLSPGGFPPGNPSSIFPNDGFPPMDEPLFSPGGFPPRGPFPPGLVPPGDIFPIIVPTTIVREVLTEGNYAYWRPCIKRFLKGQELWEACKIGPFSPHDPVYPIWKKKNDMALHAIQISCSREMLAQIRDIRLAGLAWELLKRIANPTYDFGPPAPVEEVLTKDNYAQWRVCIKQFLKTEGLWEVCKTGPDPFFIGKKKKNDMALHVLKNSCSPEMLSHITKMEFANKAWETLNRIANPMPEPPPDAPPPTEQQIVDEVLTEDNYAHWKPCIKRYLKSQGLYDVCKLYIPSREDPFSFPPIREENDRALHAIQNSCSPEILSRIKEIKLVNEAWETLKQIASPTPQDVSTPAVPEVLKKGNYPLWSSCMKQYLKRKRLWEVCKNSRPSGEDPDANSLWEKKNDRALHAIKTSCSRQILFQIRIREMKLASEAWEFLKGFANPTPDFGGVFPELPPDALASAGDSDETLIKALDDGDWDTIESSLGQDIEAWKAKVSPPGLTPLHIAVVAGNVRVVEKLVEKLNPKDLEETEYLRGYTPLALAASAGITEIAQCMLTKNSTLAGILDLDGILPVVIASNRGQKEMTRLLYSHTPLDKLAPGRDKNGASLLSYCIASQILDVALDILKKYPRLALSLDLERQVPIFVFGQMPSLFQSSDTPLWFWERWTYSCIPVKVDQASDHFRVNVPDNTQHSPDGTDNTVKVLRQPNGLFSYVLQLLGIKRIQAKKLTHIQAAQLLECICQGIKQMKIEGILGLRLHYTVIQAVKQGNVEFATEMIKSSPELLVWSPDLIGRNIFFTAILYRQAEIFSLLHGLNNVKKMKLVSDVDNFGNNMLHLAAMLAPSNQLDGIPGAALQMQSELQWFKEVESIVPPICKDLVNSDGKKPRELFSEQHANLVKEGEKWMKEIATSSSFVAALIVTIMFAAAFTIPGGNNDEGAPVFLGNDLFMLFIISDSISLFSATTSVLMFLGILTSQYAESKFLTRLPTKLIIGLSTLFFSIAAMMIAFCAALAILLKGGRSTKVVIIPIILLACIPVTLFALLQFPLLVQIFISTYGPGIFNRNIKRWY